VGDGVTAIRSNDEVGEEFAFAFQSLRPHTRHAVIFEKQIDDFVADVTKCLAAKRMADKYTA